MCVASNDLCISDLDISKALERCLKTTQRNMEGAMIGVSWNDYRTNEWVRRKTMVCNIMHVIKARKLTWTSHIARIQDNRWTSQVTDWRPMDGSRPRSRPRRDGVMKSMTSGGMLHESRMPKTDFHGRTILRPSSNKWNDNGLI